MSAIASPVVEPAEPVIRHLNYKANLDNRVIGQILGPDHDRRFWKIRGVDRKPGGGSRVEVYLLTHPGYFPQVRP